MAGSVSRLDFGSGLSLADSKEDHDAHGLWDRDAVLGGGGGELHTYRSHLELLIPRRGEGVKQLIAGKDTSRLERPALGCSGPGEAPVDLGDVLHAGVQLFPAVVGRVVLLDRLPPVDVGLKAGLELGFALEEELGTKLGPD